MTHGQDPGNARAAWAGYSATMYGLDAGGIRLHHDEHGAAHIRLAAGSSMEIRIQLAQSVLDTPEQHADGLERDRRGLLRLAAVATQLAEEIGQRQREGGAA